MSSPWQLLLHFLVYISVTKATLEQLCVTNILESKCVCGYGAGKNSRLHYVVNCARTALQEIPDIKQLPPNFSELDVSHNTIKRLSFDRADFESATLKCLKAGYNEIEEVSVEFLRNVPNLNRLELQHNRISNLNPGLFKGAHGLHHVDLSYNLLATLPAGLFHPLHKLKYLDLSYNEHLGTQLKSYTNLFDSDLKLSSNLTHLQLSHTNLTHVHPTYFENSSLTSLSLTDNHLNEIPIFPQSLEHIDLSGNNFTQLKTSEFNYPKLKTLYLNRLGRLKVIHDYTFYHLIALEVFSLAQCPQLKKFNYLAFGVPVDDEEWHLKRMSLRGNGIRSLNETYFKLFNKVASVELDDNPWDCDCHIVWFKNLKGKLSNRNFKCATPNKLRNREILRLSDKHLPKCVVGAHWRTHKIMVTVISVLVVIIVAIIMYLVYMGPYFRKSKTTANPVGATSPYTSLVVNDD